MKDSGSLPTDADRSTAKKTNTLAKEAPECPGEVPHCVSEITVAKESLIDSEWKATLASVGPFS